MQYFKFTVARQLYTAFTCFTDSKYRVTPDLPLENLKKFTFVNKEKLIDDCKVTGKFKTTFILVINKFLVIKKVWG